MGILIRWPLKPYLLFLLPFFISIQITKHRHTNQSTPIAARIIILRIPCLSSSAHTDVLFTHLAVTLQHVSPWQSSFVSHLKFQHEEAQLCLRYSFLLPQHFERVGGHSSRMYLVWLKHTAAWQIVVYKYASNVIMATQCIIWQLMLRFCVLNSKK